MLDELLRQYGLGIYYEAPDDGGSGSGRMTTPDVTEEGPDESVSLEKFTEQRLSDGDEPEDGGDGDEEGESDEGGESAEPDGDQEELEPDDGEREGSSEDQPDGEGDDADGPDEPEDGGDGDEEGDFYDPESYKEENEIGRDAPHTNKFPDRESAEYAAINKASMIQDAIDDLKELDTDRGAVPLPDALEGSLENLDDLENMKNVASMDNEELNQFLWESDEFRHRIQEKADRVEQKQQSQQITQEFEELQKDLYNGISDLMGGDENITQDVIDTLDAGPNQGREFLNEQIEAKIESEIEEDVQEIEEFIDSDEAADMSRQKFANRLEAMKSDLQDKQSELREKYNGVIETYEEAFDLAPKVQESKPKTEGEIVATAYDSLDVWQEDAAGISNLLIDDPGAKRELEAFVKNAMRNKEKFNNLQHPSDWNEAEDWWHNEFKPSIRGKQQKEKMNGEEDKSSSGSSDDDIDEPDPDTQEDIRNSDGDDVHSMNQDNLDTLVQETDAA